MSIKTLTFDTETTGVDVNNDRIITCYAKAKAGDTVIEERSWVLDPGVEVPLEASEVHGMSTAWVRENGRKDVAQAISEISDFLHSYSVHPDGHNYVIVGYNSAFDLAILNAESKRHLDGAELALENALFFDPIIISRRFDKYRKGGHKLVDIARAHGFEVDESKAHEAAYDVEMTEFLVPKMLNLAWKNLPKQRTGLTPDQFIDKLQVWQAEWKSEWASGLTSYFAKINKTENDDGETPIIVDGKFPY